MAPPKVAGIAAGHHATMLTINCVCSDHVARERISARAANQLPHRNLDEYDRLRQIFEVFDTTPDVTVDTTQDLDALPDHVVATIRQQKQPHPAQASDN
jgi:predicted kinase